MFNQWLLDLTHKVWEINVQDTTDAEFENSITAALKEYMNSIMKSELANEFLSENLIYATLTFWTQNRKSPTEEEGWWIDNLPTYILNKDNVLKSYMFFFSLLNEQFFYGFSLTSLVSRGYLHSMPIAVKLIKGGSEEIYRNNENSNEKILIFEIPCMQEVIKAISPLSEDISNFEINSSDFVEQGENEDNYCYLNFPKYKEVGIDACEKITLSKKMTDVFQKEIPKIDDKFCKLLHRNFGESDYVCKTKWSDQLSRGFVRFLLAYNLIKDFEVVYVIPSKTHKKKCEENKADEFGSGSLILALKKEIPNESDVLQNLWVGTNMVYNRLASYDWERKSAMDAKKSAKLSAVSGLAHTYKNLLSPIRYFFFDDMRKISQKQTLEFINNYLRVQKSLRGKTVLEKGRTEVPVPWYFADAIWLHLVKLLPFYRGLTGRLWAKIYTLHLGTLEKVNPEKFAKQPFDVVKELLECFAISWTMFLLQPEWDELKPKYKDNSGYNALQLVLHLPHNCEERYYLSLQQDFSGRGIMVHPPGNIPPSDGWVISKFNEIAKINEKQDYHYNIPKIYFQAIFEEISLNCIKFSTDGIIHVKLEDINGNLNFEIWNTKGEVQARRGGLVSLDELLRGIGKKLEIDDEEESSYFKVRFDLPIF